MTGIEKDDLRKAVNILINAMESHGIKAHGECERAREVVNGSDEWMEACGGWRMFSIVDDAIRFGEGKGGRDGEGR